uniref:Putative ovule protein n=1 Tax=Solanum chacoense TaxID=4108 RepID=A0A0V0H595_SOLCH
MTLSMTHIPFFLFIIISKKLSLLSFLAFYMVFSFPFLSIQNILKSSIGLLTMNIVLKLRQNPISNNIMN